MIDIFDIMKTLKNKRIRMKGEITSGIGFYNKNDINTFVADLWSIDNNYIDYVECQIDEDEYNFKFNIDVYLTEDLYEIYYNDYSELIDYYHPDAIHVPQKHKTFHFVDSMERTFMNVRTVNIELLARAFMEDREMHTVDVDEEWVERRRVR